MGDGQQGALDELRAEVAGVRANLELLDVHLRRWRDVTNSAFNLISQREAREDVERKKRQRQLDVWLWSVTVGVGVCLLLLIVLLSLFIGSQLSQGVQ